MIDPILTERVGGGWVAMSPPDEPIKVGVTADTQDEALEKYQAALIEHLPKAAALQTMVINLQSR